MAEVLLPGMFRAATLTNVLNLAPQKYGILSAQGLFKYMGIATTTAAIMREQAGLCLVQSGAWCAPPAVANRGVQRDLIYIPVPHTSIADVVLPCDIAGQVTYDLNTPTGLKDMNSEVIKRSINARSKLEQTLEYRQIRAMYGEVLDADGTVMQDLYSTFGIAPSNITWAISSATFGLRKACNDLTRLIRKRHSGNYTSIRFMVSAEGMDKIVNHKDAVDAYKRCCDTQFLVTEGTTGGKIFPFGGIEFWEYDAQGCYYDAQGVKQSVEFLAPPSGFAPADVVGVAYPQGAPEMYELLGANPMRNDMVNQRATQLYHVSIEPRCHNEGFDLKTEANALPIVKQPGSLIRVKLV